MHSIERHLRNAIEKLASDSVEARNKIYLAARETIQKLPADKQDSAMQTLFDAVKSIEADYVQKGSQPDTGVAAESNCDKQSMGPIAPDRKFSVPWGLIAVIAAVLLVMGLSSYLLYTRLLDADLIGATASTIIEPSQQFLLSGQQIRSS